MPKNKVLVVDFVTAFEIYQCYFEDTITLFSFLLLGLTSQLIADRNAAYPTDPRCGISAAYLTYPSAGSRQGWHPCNLRPCNTSNCKYKCNTCKYKCLCSAIPAANAAGAEVQKRGRQKRGQTFLHSSPDNDMNQPERSPNLIANQSMAK